MRDNGHLTLYLPAVYTYDWYQNSLEKIQYMGFRPRIITLLYIYIETHLYTNKYNPWSRFSINHIILLTYNAVLKKRNIFILES